MDNQFVTIGHMEAGEDYKVQKVQTVKYFGNGSAYEISLMKENGITKVMLGDEIDGDVVLLEEWEYGEVDEMIGITHFGVSKQSVLGSFEILYYQDEPYGINEIKAEPDEGMQLAFGDAINSKFTDFNPLVTANGNNLFFTREVEGVQAIYFSQEEDGVWQTSKRSSVNEPNTQNSIAGVSVDGSVVFINGRYKGSKYLGPGISLRHRTARGWSTPSAITIKGFHNKSPYNGFFMSNDGMVIMLSIQNGSSVGGDDLYVSFRQADGSYSKPLNLGDDLNTEGHELSPFLAPDRRTLYFSSDGHKGYGGSDIFYTRRQDSTWTNWDVPKNLGANINTVCWEGYFTVNAEGTEAFYSSDFNYHGSGEADVFRVTLPEEARPEPVVLLKGVVFDQELNVPVESQVTYSEFYSGEKVGYTFTDENGNYEIVLPVKDKYTIHAEKPGYYSSVDTIESKDFLEFENQQHNLNIQALKAGQVFTLNHVYFVRNKVELLPESKTELNLLVELMTSNPGVRIRIEGHTDFGGNESDNKRLSEDRSIEVLRYLKEQGIKKKRLESHGFGSEKPIVKGGNVLERARNRRVEFRIVEILE
jgi:outer membrane protein OmpA-like peptidoglycan-associated protein